jgi:CubicO group peptidase (beta-lactamase class C family)
MTLEVVGNRRSVLPRGVHGAADPHFACAVRSFASMFHGRRFGGGALAVYLDGEPVVDVWTGYADRRGRVPWSADSASMVFSATKGMASTVIHRLVDRGLLDYDIPVAQYWPEFAANGKADITVRQMMRHQAGLSALRGASTQDLLNHKLMERRLAAARPGYSFGRSAYHALTYGWLLSGLARAVTGKGMRELIRTELAEPTGHRRFTPGPSTGRSADSTRPDHHAAERFSESGVQRGGADDRRATTVGRIRLDVLPRC